MSLTDQLDPAAPTAAPKAKRKSVLQFELTAKKVPRKDLMHFSRQLAVFIKAGIPIIDALEAINEEMGNKYFHEIIEDAVTALRSGATFSDAMAEHSKAFPAYYLGILRSAELTGHLDTVLVQLSGYLDRDLEARRKVTSAFAYPAVILMVSAVVVVVLVAFVLPKFESFFSSLGAELPLATRLLLNTSEFLTGNALAIGAVLLLAALLVAAGLQAQAGRVLRDRLLLRLPLIGDLVQHVLLERFCRILGAMMTAGVPLPEALRVTIDATGNNVYRKGLTTARGRMLNGEGLSVPLSDTGLFPPSARQMFKVGESTGTLDQQLETAAVYFERELDYKIRRFTTLFEPAVLLLVGVIVGFVAIAVVSAMYGVFNQTRGL